jgi:hypothetical protein
LIIEDLEIHLENNLNVVDVQIAFDYLSKLDKIDSKQIVIYSVSLDVALVIYLVSQSHNSENVHACILENGFTSVKSKTKIFI